MFLFLCVRGITRHHLGRWIHLGIYQINKKQMKVEFFTPSTFGDCDIRPDKYIRSIIKTSDGSIWSGGYYNLKQIDFNRKNIRAYPGT